MKLKDLIKIAKKEKALELVIKKTDHENFLKSIYMRNKKTFELEKYEKEIEITSEIIAEAKQSDEVNVISLSHPNGSSQIIFKINCFVDKKEEVLDLKGYSKKVFDFKD